MHSKKYLYELTYNHLREQILNCQLECGSRLPSIQQLANMYHVSTKTISAIERGKNGISVATLMDLCKYLEVSTDYILFGYDTDINYVIQKKLKRLHPMQMKFVERIMDEIIPLVQCMYEEGVLVDDKTMLDKTES